MKLTPFFKPIALFLLAAAVSFTLAAGPAVSGEPTQQLKSGINAVLDILRDSKLRGNGKKSEFRSKL
ncbi:MAG: hypothetical protein V3U53_00170, partial [bacterium]